jgi:hypothetical protein
MAFNTSPGTTLAGLGAGPIYLHAGHVASSAAVLNLGRSADGINVTPIGDTIPFTAQGILADDTPRDPVIFYHAATRKFGCLYTHTGSATPAYAKTLGFCETRDLARWNYVDEIPINGTGLSGTWFVWSGHYIEDAGGRCFATLSTLAGGLAANLVIGYIEFNDPGVDWTDVTDFVPLTRDNPLYTAFLVGREKPNDLCVIKHAGVYHYFFDCGADGSHDIFHATSTVLFSGMTTPVSLGIRALVGQDVEGQYIVRNPTDDGWILFLQIIFGPVNYIRLDEDFAPIGTPLPVNWPVAQPIGNGSAIRITDLDASRAAMSAPQMRQFVDENVVNNVGRVLLPTGSYFYTYAKSSELGNGFAIIRSGDTHSSTTIDGLAKTSDLVVGMAVSGSGIPTGATIATIASSTSITISAAATTTVADGDIVFKDVLLHYVTRTGGTISHFFSGTLSANEIRATDGLLYSSGTNPQVNVDATTGFARVKLSRSASGNGYQFFQGGDDVLSFYCGAAAAATVYCTVTPAGLVTFPLGIVLPTSATGLPSGALWNNAGTPAIKP